MIIPKINRNILKEVAAENEVSFNEAVEAVYSQFNFLSEVIHKARLEDLDSYMGVRLPRFGLFKPHINKILRHQIRMGVNEEYN